MSLKAALTSAPALRHFDPTTRIYAHYLSILIPFWLPQMTLFGVQKDCPDYFCTHIFFSVSNFILVTFLVIITNTKISGSNETYYQQIVLHHH